MAYLVYMMVFNQRLFRPNDSFMSPLQHNIKGTYVYMVDRNTIPLLSHFHGNHVAIHLFIWIQPTHLTIPSFLPSLHHPFIYSSSLIQVLYFSLMDSTQLFPKLHYIPLHIVIDPFGHITHIIRISTIGVHQTLIQLLHALDKSTLWHPNNTCL